MQEINFQILLGLTFLAISSLASIAYIIQTLQRAESYSVSLRYYKNYFILAIFTYFVVALATFNEIVIPFNILVFSYFLVSIFLLVALSDFHKKSHIKKFLAFLLWVFNKYCI